MRNAGPQKLDKLLHQGTSLQKLQEKSLELHNLTLATNELFKQFGLSQVRMANIRNGIMIIEASSAPWANRLKQLRQNLLSELRQQLPSLISIDIVINPSLNTIKQQNTKDDAILNKNSSKKHRISRQAATHITTLAEQAPDDIKERLLKLAQLAEKRPKIT